MSGKTPCHDFLLPRLAALVDDAVATGFARDVVVAVLIDVATGAGFDDALLDLKKK